LQQPSVFGSQRRVVGLGFLCASKNYPSGFIKAAAYRAPL
jgi:hypothetical protein